MANLEQLERLKRDVAQWNTWRAEHPGLKPDLYRADLYGVDLTHARLDEADLRKADLYRANLMHAQLQQADLREAKLGETNLLKARLDGADLRGADLSLARLVETNLNEARMTGSIVYGISAWDLQLEGTDQRNLIITRPYFDEPEITVDRLEVAQFIYLLLNNAKIREVIDTITSKVVLILGRFTPERKAILDALREELRGHNLLPVLFDFERPASRDLHETVTTLARLARFVVADITEPRSIPQELVSIVESMPSLPVQPILHAGHEPWGMYDHIQRYPWVLRLARYADLGDLLTSITEKVIAPAESYLQRDVRE